jgi:hypothetical protein
MTVVADPLAQPVNIITQTTSSKYKPNDNATTRMIDF